MRKLKKTLGLVLALVMLLTIFPVVASANVTSIADYPDRASIQYVEAVDVLTAIRVMQGEGSLTATVNTSGVTFRGGAVDETRT